MTLRAVDGPVQTVSGLQVEPQLLRDVITELTAIGSSPLGFRTTGTPEDAQVADVVARRFAEAGLTDVAVEPVPVDAWRFVGAQVAAGGQSWICSSFGGVPGTVPGGITARLVDVGDPRRARLDRLDLNGAIVLVDWLSKALHPSVFALELARRGVQAMIVTCPPGGAYYQGERAMGGFDGHWPAAGPPMVIMAKEDAAQLRASGCTQATVTLQVEVRAAATGYNVVGYLPGELAGPIVVGAHHDAWFRGAFDNTSGVAATVALAAALVAAGHRPRHTICFSTRTGEEFGTLDSPYDWCVGAWQQVHSTHPDWAHDAPFHLCVEASGHPALRSVIEAPVELRGWAKRVCRAAQEQGWTPTGWRVAPPVSGTEQWPYLVAGVPGIAAYAWESSFADTDYHSQLDTLDMIDVDIVAAQVRLYALLLLDADADPEAVFDHGVRARELASIASRHEHTQLAAVAERHRHLGGRAAFGAVGRAVFALDAHAALCYPHEQAERDTAAIDAALAALRANRPGAALRSLRTVGVQHLHDYLSRTALHAYTARFATDRLAGSWGAASHPTRSVVVWDEIEALRNHRRVPVDTPALISTLTAKRDTARRDMTRRLDAMARSLASPNRSANHSRTDSLEGHRT